MKTGVQRGEQYARDVIAGKIPACKWIKQAAQRHFDDLEKSKSATYPFKFDKKKAERPIVFVENLHHVKGKWAKQKMLLHLEGWECFIAMCLFGWVHKKNGRRRFREAYLEIPRKNGKSIFIGAIGLFMWCMDGEAGAEVYSGATTEKQAWEVFGPARLMVEKSEDLLEVVGEDAVWAKSLVVDADQSRFLPLIGKPGDGASPSCAIVDEFHEHDTSDFVDTMKTGMLAREQPLLLKITTAGYNLAGPCYDDRIQAQHVLEGIAANDELFAMIWTIDEDDDWADPKVLAKANPNFGVSVDADILEADQRQAVLNPIHQNRFKTKHLNVWCSARVAWMPIHAWNLCGDDGLSIDEFMGQEAYFILDLASKDDIACFGKLFKKRVRELDHYYAFMKYYLPESAILTPGPNQAAYRKWVQQKLIHVTEGEEIDFDVICADVLDDKNKFQMLELVYDPWRATQLAHQLQKAGATTVEMNQTVQNMSPPMKEVLSAVKGGRFHHDNHPVTGWMMSNVTAKTDAKDNIYPRKEKQHMKIDGAVTIIMGVGRAMFSVQEAGFEEWLRDPVVVG